MEKVEVRNLSHQEGSTKKHRKHAKSNRQCNLCGNKFSTVGAHILFCSRCRESNDVIRFSEWLPEIATDDYAEISADFDFEKAA